MSDAADMILPAGLEPDEVWKKHPATLVLTARLASSEQEHAVVEAVLYAMREGCFFPLPEPKGDESTQELIQWGALRNLHDKVAALTAAAGGRRE